MRLDQEGFGSLSAVLAIASHRNGRQFLWACCAPLLRLHPQGNVPAWAFAGRTFRRLWGMSVPFSLSAPLLCQIIVAILCGNFEQFANKRPHGWMPQCKNRPGFLLWKPGRFVCFICAFSSAHAIRSRNYLRGFLIAACSALYKQRAQESTHLRYLFFQTFDSSSTL